MSSKFCGPDIIKFFTVQPPPEKFPIILSGSSGCVIDTITVDVNGAFQLPDIEILSNDVPLGDYSSPFSIDVVGDVGISGVTIDGSGCNLTINLDNLFPIEVRSKGGCLIDTISTNPSGVYELPSTTINDDDGLFGTSFIGTSINIIGGTISGITSTNAGCDTNIILNEVESSCLPINVINSDGCELGVITECPSICTGFTWNLRVGPATTVQGIELLDCEGNIYETITETLGQGDYSFCHNSLSLAPEITNQTGVSVTWGNTGVVCDTGEKYFTLADIPVSDDTGSLGSVAVPTSVVIEGEATVALSGCVLTIRPTGGSGGEGINYQRPTWAGQITSYVVGDVGWQASAGTYNWVYTGATTARLDYSSADPFYTLVENNAFGNTFRFTTDNGTPASDGKADFVSGDFTGATDNYIIDHLTGYGWARGKVAFQELWATAVATANGYTLGAYSDFRLPSIGEIESVLSWQGAYYDSENILDRFAFISGNDSTLWLSNTDELVSTANAYKLFAAGDIRRQGKTSTVATGTYICRTHY